MNGVSNKKMGLVETDNWYQQLIKDIKIHTQIKIVQAKHYCGRRILQEKEKLESIYGKRFVEQIAEDLDVSKSDIWKCIQFAEKYPELCNDVTQLSWHYIVNHLLPNSSLVSKFTGDQENYTPEQVVNSVLDVLGTIDLDPASCEYAQKIVKAGEYFTENENGLNHSWYGNVFLNPPYQMPEIRNFTNKLIKELSNINSAILLTNNNTDTKWFHKCARYAQVICFTTGRINFYTSEIAETQPTNGQTFFYFGENENKFIDVFSKHGMMMKVLLNE